MTSPGAAAPSGHRQPGYPGRRTARGTIRSSNLPLEIIEDGKNGLLVRPDDTEQIALAIHRIVVDHELRATIARNAKITAARFSLDRVVDGVAEVCRVALARRSARPER